MASVTLIHTEETFTVPVLQAITKCSLFQKNLTLPAAPYRVRSTVSLAIFREFVSELEGKAVQITDTNVAGLQRLCEEFGFDEFAAKLSGFRPSTGLQRGQDADARGRIAVLEEKAAQHDLDTEALQCQLKSLATDFEQLAAGMQTLSNEVSALKEQIGAMPLEIATLQDTLRGYCTDFGRLAGEVSALRFSAAGMQTLSDEFLTLKEQIVAGRVDPVAQRVPTEFSELQKELSILKSQIAALTPPSTRHILNRSPSGLLRAASVILPIPSVPSLNSRIISDYPEIFTEFRWMRFSRLWRGSRDGFKAREFHRRCNGHANTLTLIVDTDGNIFGGFTPVEWELNSGFKADDSQQSFLFTLKNPHNFPARRFALKAEKKYQAIVCEAGQGPHFGGDCYCDIVVSDKCNANNNNATYLGGAYTNDTRLNGDIVFTGARNFKVKEIEVFQITN